MATVESIFEAQGVPSSIWQNIMTVESGGDPNTYYETPYEASVGLFQLNTKGGLGAGYSIKELQNPELNATIAAKAMAPTYKRGVAKGLTGLDLLRYVAYGSGWPTTMGVGALQTDSVVQSYDVKLVKAYNGGSDGVVVGGGSGGGSTSGGGGGGGGGGSGSGSGTTKKWTSSIAGASDSMSLKIFFTVMGGAIVLLGLKVLTDVPMSVAVGGGE